MNSDSSHHGRLGQGCRTGPMRSIGRIGLIGLIGLLGVVLGGTGGFIVGRRAQGTLSDQRRAATAPAPPAIAGARGAAQRAAGAPGTAGGATATPNLAGLPAGEAWRKLLAIDDPAAKADAVRLLLDSMPPGEWPVWLSGMIDSFQGEDFDDDDPEQMAGLFGTLSTLLRHMVATHPRECLTAMLSLDKKHSHGDDLIEGFMRSWARHDVDAARQFYEQEIAGAKHGKADDIAGGLVREMAKANPRAALDWAAGLTDEDARERATITAFEAVLKTNRSEALSLFTTATDLPERAHLAERIASHWARSEPAAAMEWAQTLPADLRRDASRQAFEGWLERDFNAARTAFEGCAPDTKSLLLSSMVQRAPKDQIGALADVLAAEPVSAGRAEASQTLMRKWVDQDPTAATGWLAQQPAGEVQDRAIVGFLGWADGYEPQAALEWAGTISEPRLRTEHLDQLVNRLRSSDPTMVRNWLDSTGRLTSAERARFLELTRE